MDRSRLRSSPLTLPILSLLLGACVHAPPPEQISRSDIDLLVLREGERAAYIKAPGGNTRVCAPRESDAGVASSVGLSLSLPGLSGDEDASVKDGQTVTGLGGRGPLALVARELLFRACELALNTNADADTTRDIYAQFLSALVKISSHSGNRYFSDPEDSDERGDDDDSDSP